MFSFYHFVIIHYYLLLLNNTSRATTIIAMLCAALVPCTFVFIIIILQPPAPKAKKKTLLLDMGPLGPVSSKVMQAKFSRAMVGRQVGGFDLQLKCFLCTPIVAVLCLGLEYRF